MILSQGRRRVIARTCPPEAALADVLDLQKYFSSEQGNEFWELWLSAAKLDFIVEQCIATTEPAFAAKYAFQLAQNFNNFYHRHHILSEEDAAKKKFLLATVAVVVRSLTRTLALLGISVPPVM